MRFRCVGCGHFSTDVSYLPDLETYLADLLRNGNGCWPPSTSTTGPRPRALPSDAEISRVRRLINRVKADLDGLSDDERAQIEDAVALVRRTRRAVVGLGMPRVRQPLPDVRPERTA